MLPLNLMVAYDRNRIIGADGSLPWHYPQDLKHFKRTTMGHAIIHGRKSFEDFGKPLPGRRNIILTRRPGYQASGCEVVSDLASAIALARETDPEPFILGGAEVYRQALPHITRMYLTEIDASHSGDTKFPEFDEAQWQETQREEDGILVFRTLERC